MPHEQELGLPASPLGARRAPECLALSRYALTMLLLCVVASMAEGYDTLVMALAAPLIRRTWALQSSSVGILLSASVIGLVIGSFVLSPLGDRWGRRIGILLGLSVVGVATLLGAFAPDQWSLLVTRFVSGLGLGLAFPNISALAMELMPAKLRSFAVVLVGCGIPLGGTAGGIVAARLIATHGYPVIFVIGGVTTLLIALVVFLFLPESPFYLARKLGDDVRVKSLLRRLGTVSPEALGFVLADEALPTRSPVSALFQRDYRLTTVLLWVVNLANMLMVYYFITWLPTIIASRGVSAQSAILLTSAYTAGGIFGGLVMALLLSRIGATIVLCGAYAVAAASTAALSALHSLGASFFFTLILAGGVISGSLFCLNAVVNQFYPTAMRVTASGYANGFGRLGAVAAPVIGTVVMAHPLLARFAFSMPALPALIALATVLTLHIKTDYARATTPI